MSESDGVKHQCYDCGYWYWELALLIDHGIAKQHNIDRLKE